MFWVATTVLTGRVSSTRQTPGNLLLGEGNATPNANQVLVIVPGARETRLLEHLMNRFDLTLAEAKLAHRLANGAALKEAADALGIREQTARTYLKRVFQKTETCRQAELVHKIAVEPLIRSDDSRPRLGEDAAKEAIEHWQTEQ